MNERDKSLAFFPLRHNETCEFLCHMRTRKKNDLKSFYARAVFSVSAWKKTSNAAQQYSQLKQYSLHANSTGQISVARCDIFFISVPMISQTFRPDFISVIHKKEISMNSDCIC